MMGLIIHSWESLNLIIHSGIEHHFQGKLYEPPQKPDTKYVLDGHWFMEIDGNCSKNTR
jgi:hypothetical protein